MTDLNLMGRAARLAARKLASSATREKDTALRALADALEAGASRILLANSQDVAAGKQAGLTDALLDRLTLNPARLGALVTDTRQIADLPDPVGEEFDSRVLPNGMRLLKRRVPIGVIGVVYEARPNVTIDIATLCLKTGNACILRGGKETLRTNIALVEVIHRALTQAGLPPNAVQYIENPDRAYVTELLRLDRYIDMIVPRGGEDLHRLCREQATIPVITGGMGVCHMFVDESADLARAVDVVENAKVQRPSVCNALDTLLVHRKVAPRFLTDVAARLAGAGVALHVDEEGLGILVGGSHGARYTAIEPTDYDREWLSLNLSVRVVDGIDQAIEHIHQHSTEHSDAILTNDVAHARRFVDEVDSAAVYVNASTRFTDGGQFGLGAEVAVSTQKLHARGPLGLTELTTYKWIGYGDMHIRP